MQGTRDGGLVLIVEDNRNISEMVGEYLESRGFEVDYAADGLDGYRLATENSYDVIVLDLMLPRMDGIEVCKKLREEARKSTPVLMLTARDTLDEKLTGLSAGADDYLTKPFDYRELEARARALLRRSEGLSDNMLRFGPLAIDRAGRIASVGERPLNLTRRELTVLEILATRPGRIVPKEELVEQLFSFDQEPSPNAVEQFVARLRRKLGDAPVEIRTMRGLGYQLATT